MGAAMDRSLYDILGVTRGASEEEIRAAYRRLAKRWHPDFNRGDPRAERMFKRITAAYEILGDPEKRRRYDRGEIDEEGRERVRARSFWRAAEGRPGFEFERGTFGGFEEVINEILGRGRGGFGFGESRPGREERLRLEIDLATAARGGRERVRLADGRTLEVTIPPGVETGRVLRMRGQAPGGIGAPRGDLLLEIVVREHPRFRRRGLDLHLDHPVPLEIAVLGGRIRVPTIDGEVVVAVPPGSSSGRVLRLRGKGVVSETGRRGDQLVRLQLVLPEDPELRALLRRWAEGRRAPAE